MHIQAAEKSIFASLITSQRRQSSCLFLAYL